MTVRKKSSKDSEPDASTSLLQRPHDLPHGSWLGDFPKLSSVEKRLITACGRGDVCVVGVNVPSTPTVKTRIRANLVRFLLLGGDSENPAHAAGVQIVGAWIDGTLDLDSIQASAPLRLLRCKLEDIHANSAKIPLLSFSGSCISKLTANRLKVDDTVSLNRGFIASNEVSLIGACIGGILDCSGGSFNNTDADGASNGDALSLDGAYLESDVVFGKDFKAIGSVRLPGVQIDGDLVCRQGSFVHSSDDALPKRPALFFDRAVIKGSVFLDKGFSAIGEVRLLGAHIGGNFGCSGGSFRNAREGIVSLGDALALDRAIIDGSLIFRDGFIAVGAVRLVGTHVRGNLVCTNGIFGNADIDGKSHYSLNADSLNVDGGLFLRGGSFAGLIDLTAAHATSIADDMICWPNASLLLDGFDYARIPAGPCDARSRVTWLKRQVPEHLMQDFRPQPWEQLIKVLRDMGHPYEATKVAIAKQRQWRKSWQLPWWRPRRWLNKIYGVLAGYGYRPWWTVGWMAGMCCLCSLFYYEGSHDGLFGPTSPPIQLSAKLEGCGDGGTPGKIYWTSPDCPMPPEYTSFQPFLYSLDLILPFVDLQQEGDWAPIVSNEKGQPLLAGHLLRFVMWFEILFGWLTGVLLAAVASNLVKKD